jgi:hypothetical protein
VIRQQEEETQLTATEIVLKTPSRLPLLPSITFTQDRKPPHVATVKTPSAIAPGLNYIRRHTQGRSPPHAVPMKRTPVTARGFPYNETLAQEKSAIGAMSVARISVRAPIFKPINEFTPEKNHTNVKCVGSASTGA